MELEDLNPRSKPTRSPSVPLICTPSVPEVSLMLNNPQWQNSQKVSPIENTSRISEYQKRLSASKCRETNTGMTGSNVQSFNLMETVYNTQKNYTPKSDIYHGYKQQVEKFHHSSEETRETSDRNKFIGRAFQNSEKCRNIYTDLTDNCHNKKQQIEYINNTHQIALNTQENTNQEREFLQHTPGREINKADSRKSGHYQGWRTYFEDRTSGAQCSIQTSFRSAGSFHISSKEKKLYSNPISSTQNQHNTQILVDDKESQVPANSKEKEFTIKEITESQLQNIILKIISNLENSSNPQNGKENTSASHTSSQRDLHDTKKNVQTEKSYVNNRQNMPVTVLVDKEVSPNEKQLSHNCSNSQNSPEYQNIQLTPNKNGIFGITDDKGKGHSKIDCDKDEETGNHNCECHISITKMYKLLRSQTTHLQALQKKVDKIMLQQENSLRISECAVSKREQTELLSQRRPRKMVHVSTQTVELFHREIAVGTDPKETASVGVMTTYETPEHVKDDVAFLLEKKQILHGAICEGSRRSSHEQTVSEDLHNQDSICLNCLDLPSLQVQAPSPMPSIHVDMHDFEEEEEEEKEEEEEDDDSNSELSHCSNSNVDTQQPRVGWTFYNNVVNQVNKLLKDTSNGKVENRDLKYMMNKDRPNEVSLSDVRKATIEELKKMGISFHSKGEQDVHTQKAAYPHLRKPNDHGPTESDRSLQFNALAMKYLREENYSEAQVCNISMKATNFSLATLRYLERYHLLPPDIQQNPCREAVNNQVQAKADQNVRHVGNFDKILDVTTIKNQPKLL